MDLGYHIFRHCFLISLQYTWWRFAYSTLQNEKDGNLLTYENLARGVVQDFLASDAARN